ncbi:M14 family metallopeptidase [Ancylobacter sp. sgz301288]
MKQGTVIRAASAGSAEVERGAIEIGTLASGRPVQVPYMLRRGRQPGPCLWVNGAVHGDEINGVFAAQRFFERVRTADLAGTVVVTPVSNVLAFDERRKTTAIDGIDMDQSFPGRADGFATERLAAKLFERFGGEADVTVNIHTLGTPFTALPYAVYKVHPNGSVPESRLLSLISCFEPTVACRMPVSGAGGELPGNIAGALDYQMLARGKAAFMVELGSGGCLDEAAVEQGVRGLARLAARLGMIEKHSVGQGAPRLRRVTARAHKLAASGGLFEPLATPGTVLPAGAPLGRVRNLFGDIEEEIVVEGESHIIAMRRDPVVHSGDRVAFLASRWDEVTTHDG